MEEENESKGSPSPPLPLSNSHFPQQCAEFDLEQYLPLEPVACRCWMHAVSGAAMRAFQPRVTATATAQGLCARFPGPCKPHLVRETSSAWNRLIPSRAYACFYTILSEHDLSLGGRRFLGSNRGGDFSLRSTESPSKSTPRAPNGAPHLTRKTSRSQKQINQLRTKRSTT